MADPPAEHTFTGKIVYPDDIGEQLAALTARAEQAERMELTALRQRDDAQAENARLRDALRKARPSVEWFSSSGNSDAHDVLAEIDRELEGRE